MLNARDKPAQLTVSLGNPNSYPLAPYRAEELLDW
jgi:hypothetical protein